MTTLRHSQFILIKSLSLLPAIKANQHDTVKHSVSDEWPYKNFIYEISCYPHSYLLCSIASYIKKSERALENVLAAQKVTRWNLTYYIISAVWCALHSLSSIMRWNKLSNAMEESNDSYSSWPAFFCGLLSLAFSLSDLMLRVRKNYWVIKVYDHCQMHFSLSLAKKYFYSMSLCTSMGEQSTQHLVNPRSKSNSFIAPLNLHIILLTEMWKRFLDGMPVVRNDFKEIFNPSENFALFNANYENIFHMKALL